MRARWALWAALAFAGVALAAAATRDGGRAGGVIAPAAATGDAARGDAADAVGRRKKKVKPYTSPSGLFIQVGCAGW